MVWLSIEELQEKIGGNLSESKEGIGGFGKIVVFVEEMLGESLGETFMENKEGILCFGKGEVKG